MGLYSSLNSFDEYLRQPKYESRSWDVDMGDYYCIPNQHPQEETIWRYTYDDQGNWVQRDCYKVKHGAIDIEDLQESITRDYIYY